MTGTPKADTFGKQIKAHSMVEKASASLAKECQRLCSVEDCINGAKGQAKNAK